jgi:hypothetical protein
MSDNNQDYHCMRDHYLELLWAAQKVEDCRLTELILRRLKDTALEMTVAPAPACEIIPFPSTIVYTSGCADRHDDMRLIWPREPLRHLLSMICGYAVVVLFFGFFGITA